MFKHFGIGKAVDHTLDQRDRVKADEQRQDRQRHQKICAFFLIFHHGLSPYSFPCSAS